MPSSSSPNLDKYFTTLLTLITQPLFWMFYSYSSLILSISSLFTSLNGVKHYQFFYTFIPTCLCLSTSSFLNALIHPYKHYAIRSSIFVATFNLITFWTFVQFPVLSSSLYPLNIPSIKPLLLFSFTCLPIPYFGTLVLTKIHDIREKSLVKQNHVRYLNSFAGILCIGFGIGLYYYQEDKSSPWSVIFFIFLSQFVLSLMCLLGTKTEFGLYDLCIQNALGHALASFGLGKEGLIVFLVCSMLTIGRYFVEDLDIDFMPIERVGPYPRISALSIV